MQGDRDFERCLPFINSESLGTQRPATVHNERRPPAITLSRQSGCGAHCVAGHLAEDMQTKAPGPVPWVVFDRNLVETILQEHNLPVRISRFMPEDRVPDLVDALDELLGLHPPVWRLLQQTVETISHLAARGNSILIGRGAHIITSGRENVFHVRLVSSLAKRVEHVQATRGIGRDEALSVIRKEDRGRQRYLKKYFNKDIDDPLSYHLVVNTEFISYRGAARLIAEAAMDHFDTCEKKSSNIRPSHARPLVEQWFPEIRHDLVSDLP